MTETTTTDDIKRELRDARASLHDDFAELDHHLHVDVPETISDKAPIIAAGAAVLGVLLGYSGKKTIKALGVAGIAAGAAFVLLRRMQR